MDIPAAINTRMDPNGGEETTAFIIPGEYSDTKLYILGSKKAGATFMTFLPRDFAPLYHLMFCGRFGGQD